MPPKDPDTPDPAAERDALHRDLLAPLTTISVRMELLLRITSVTPGLTDLERTALLEGLAATQAAAQKLREILESRLACQAPPNSVCSDAATPSTDQAPS